MDSSDILYIFAFKLKIIIMKKLLFTLFLSLLTLTMSAQIQRRFLGNTLGVSTPAQVKANAWFGINEDEADRLDMEHESLSHECIRVAV